MGAEILSVDSMQVYRGMDIGTAKPSRADRERVRHHLVDIVEPEDDFTVAAFQEAGRRVVRDLDEAGGRALIAGGSGLHFRALVDPMRFPPTDPEVRAAAAALDPHEAAARLVAADPDAAGHVDLANPRRVVRALEILELTGATPSQRAAAPHAAALRSYRAQVPLTVIGFDPGDDLAERVERRCRAMVDAGLLDEVAGLQHRLGPTAAQAVGYKELLPVVAGERDLADGIADVVRATLALAKRQRTFFGRDPRVRWLPWRADQADRAAAARAALAEEDVWSS